MGEKEFTLYTANPSETTEDWYVWDMYEPLPPKPVFVGSMEEAGWVADRLNARIEAETDKSPLLPNRAKNR